MVDKRAPEIASQSCNNHTRIYNQHLSTAEDLGETRDVKAADSRCVLIRHGKPSAGRVHKPFRLPLNFEQTIDNVCLPRTSAMLPNDSIGQCSLYLALGEASDGNVDRRK